MKNQRPPSFKLGQEVKKEEPTFRIDEKGLMMAKYQTIKGDVDQGLVKYELVKGSYKFPPIVTFPGESGKFKFLKYAKSTGYAYYQEIVETPEHWMEK